MAASDTLVTLIEKVVDRHGNDGFITGEVTEVNRDALTCSVRLDEDLILEDCRLNAVQSPEHSHCFAVIPKVGSFVSGVATADLRDVLIVSFSEIDSILINAPKIEANDFKTQIDKMSARIDGIIVAIKNGTPGAQDGGAALQQSIVALLPTDKEDFNTLADYESD